MTFFQTLYNFITENFSYLSLNSLFQFLFFTSVKPMSFPLSVSYNVSLVQIPTPWSSKRLCRDPAPWGPTPQH